MENKKDIESFTSFKPIVGNDPKILILGTAPGEKSLGAKEYYSNPRNCFWKIISHLFNNGVAFKDYEEKKKSLTNHHIALWDVYVSGERKGSADNAIKNEQVAEIEAFLSKHPNINKIVFNGKRARDEYEKMKIFGPSTFLAPSTSGAHAIPFDEKLREWALVLK